MVGNITCTISHQVGTRRLPVCLKRYPLLVERGFHIQQWKWGIVSVIMSVAHHSGVQSPRLVFTLASWTPSMLAKFRRNFLNGILFVLSSLLHVECIQRKCLLFIFFLGRSVSQLSYSVRNTWDDQLIKNIGLFWLIILKASVQNLVASLLWDCGRISGQEHMMEQTIHLTARCERERRD
jgi:hypothetical protein